ncbi:hypothetical protein [Salinisphaera sp. Q1T1-3]|uniref:hypothetical protein n=1 Tax=Salinisphaera sp. Q1T1-3 TaxID=2321229 RepID=UPI000E70997C|nr:hypothetical protein [Salinisphaera sp. Q1T1-3]RJS94730.1 hypothetical protein D3260_02845 [Salinisphaera sp. Q1T1-3]
MDASNRLYCFWLGDNTMPPARRSALDSLARTGFEIILITPDNLDRFVPPEIRHPAYPHLNLAHRADYLRCYFMHHVGGGYADIKWATQSWRPSLARLNADSNLLAAGYAEDSPTYIANLDHQPSDIAWRRARVLAGRLQRRYLQRHYRRLIGTCAFICKPATPLTTAWWAELNRRLDRLAPALSTSPARTPRERAGEMVDGKPSHYPVPWTYLLGHILHPLALKYAGHIDRGLPPPQLDHPDHGNYRAS